MPYAVELFFDPQAETAVRATWQALHQAGLPTPSDPAAARPHVSLGVFDNDQLSEQALGQILTNFARKIKAIPLLMQNVGIFPTAESVLFLGVTVTQELLELHTTFQTAFAADISDLRPYYQTGKWVPHCTLSIGAAAQDWAAIITLCTESLLPLQATPQAIGLTKVSPTSFRLLQRVEISP